MTDEEILCEIQNRCRLAMNGVVSSSMREHGLTYQLNFGVSLGKIKEIAQGYRPSTSLSEKLWKEEVREFKILATLLYPSEEFSEETANRWLPEIINQEIREQVCFNLLQNTPFAYKLVKEWSNMIDAQNRATGYWLCARLLKIKKATKIELTDLGTIFSDVLTSDISLRHAALLALKMLGRKNEETSVIILQWSNTNIDQSDKWQMEVYENLKFEFEYYFSKD